MVPIDEPGKPVNKRMCLWNGFIAAAPGHPYLAKAIETVVNQVRNRFTSVIAMVSMLGMVIGVASLITVLSVMNGFGGELRGRILSLVPHGYVANPDGGIADWDELGNRLMHSPGVVAVSPLTTPAAMR